MVEQGHREQYLEQLVLSMRVRDFPTERIRETLSEVEAHLDAGGEDPVDAFGEPSEFAASLDAARSRPVRQRRAHAASLAIIGAGSLVAVWSVLSGMSALLADGGVEISVGGFLAFVVLAAGAAIVWRLFVAYADGRGSIWPAVAGSTATVVGSGVLGAMITRPALFEVPWWAALVVGAVAALATGMLVRSEPLYPRGGSNGEPTLRVRRDAHGRRSPEGVTQRIRRAKAGLTALMLESAGWRVIILLAVVAGGLAGGLWLADVVPARGGLFSAVGLIVGLVLGFAGGAMWTRVKYGIEDEQNGE